VESIEITTDRLLLREFRDDDWSAVHEYAVDPEVVRYMPWGPNTEDETRAFIARALAAQADEPRTKYELAVALRGSGRLIGGCGIRIARPADRGGDMGYCLHRGYWGHGYASEAARAIAAFGFERLGLHRVWATCDTENDASARVLEKLGMRREARFREDTRLRGQWRDSYLYAVLEHEWKALGSDEAGAAGGAGGGDPAPTDRGGSR
jgi:RimJ/RimL family protein N-acetyltransferase